METSNAEITTLSEIAAADAKAPDESGGDSAPPVKVADTSEDTSTWTEKAQKRYDELTRKTYEALGERDRERYQREALQAENAALKAEKAKPSEVAPQETFPTLEQFGYDEQKFAAAVTAYNKATIDASGKAAREAAREELRLERENENQGKAAQRWATKEAELIKSKPDYVEKVQRAANLPISKEMQAEILNSELGPQIALYLVDNREKALAIMAMPFTAQLKEMGRIEARLEDAVKAATTKPPVSQAPPPVAKIDATDGSLTGISTTDPKSDGLSDDAWVKAENARLARKNKRQGG